MESILEAGFGDDLVAMFMICAKTHKRLVAVKVDILECLVSDDQNDEKVACITKILLQRRIDEHTVPKFELAAVLNDTPKEITDSMITLLKKQIDVICYVLDEIAEVIRSGEPTPTKVKMISNILI